MPLLQAGLDHMRPQKALNESADPSRADLRPESVVDFPVYGKRQFLFHGSLPWPVRFYTYKYTYSLPPVNTRTDKAWFLTDWARNWILVALDHEPESKVWAQRSQCFGGAPAE